MRTLVVIGGLVSLARIASAEPEKQCYAGTQVDTIVTTGKPEHVVVLRVVDRANKKILQTIWSDHDPDRSMIQSMVVDPDHGTFMVDHLRAQETGTLDGKPWQWTSYHGKTSMPAVGVELHSETRLTADKLVTTTSMQRDGKPELGSRLEANAFDCKQLDAKRAALDHTSPNAVHTCYEGTSVGEGKRQVVIDQVVDLKAKTIELRRWTQGSDAVRRPVLAIDGGKIVQPTAFGDAVVYPSGMTFQSSIVLP